MFDRYAAEKEGSGSLPPERFYQVAPSRTSKNILCAKLNVVVFIMNLLAREEELVVNKSYTLHTTSENYLGEAMPLLP